MIVAPGTTSNILTIQIVDDNGLAVTGLVAATFPSLFYSLATNTASTAITPLSDLAAITTAFTAKGVKEREAGYYRVDVPDAAFTTAGTVRIEGEASGKHVICEPIVVADLPANVLQWNSTNVSSPATAGIPDVNVKNYNNQTAATDANNLPKVDVEDWKANAVVTPITNGVPAVDWTPSPAELTGTATASAAGSITLAAAASATANFYSGMTILITSGTGKGQSRLISGYTTGRVASVTPAWTTTPASTATYIIFPMGPAELEGLLFGNSSSGAAVTNASAGILDVNTKNYNNQAAQTDANNLPKVDVEDWKANAVPATNVNGVPLIDAKYLLGTIFVTPATAGIMDVNAKNINNVSTSSVTTINANQGTTQPVNFDGTGATAYVKSDVEHWVTVAPNALVQGKVDAADNSRSNTAQAGAAGTITLDSGASATDQFYRGMKITIVSGTGSGQGSRLIGGYTGSTKVASVVPNWTVTPDSTSVFIISTWCGTDVELWELVTPNGLVSGRVDVSVGAMASNVITASAINAAALNGKGDWLLASNYTTPPTTAQIATGIFQDTTASDFTTAGSIGKSLAPATLGTVPGAAGGLFIAGSNAGTTVNFTGNLSGSVGSVTAAVTIATNEIPLKKNTALNSYEFLMVQSSDHATPATGLTVAGQVSINGGAFTNLTNSVVEVGNGVYKVNLAAGDTNGDTLTFRFTATNADQTTISHLTQ